MTVKEKIQKVRELYILTKGKAPSSVIIGYEVAEEIKKEMPSRVIVPGAMIYGMKIIIDNDKPTRAEAGDFET